MNDPILGLCSKTTIKAEEPGYETVGDNHYWDLVPWDRMPISRSHLERGEPFVLIPDELAGVERELYNSDPFPVKSELNIQIFVGDEWAGLVGFSDTEKAQVWTAEDLSLLTTAATVIGAFWEREAANQRLEELVRSKDEFLASVSHELRTPITAVVGFGDECGDFAPLVWFLGWSGLRFGEATALRVGRVDPSRRRIRVEEATTEVGGRLVVGPPKTHEARTVIVPHPVEAMRSRYRRQESLRRGRGVGLRQ